MARYGETARREQALLMRERMLTMQEIPLCFSVQSSVGQQETLAISIGGNRAGEATVSYDAATASIHGRVDLEQSRVGLSQLDEFHRRFAAELLAYVLDRGAMAQDSLGEIRYDLGGQSLALPLPNYPEVGLGYPNSW